MNDKARNTKREIDESFVIRAPVVPSSFDIPHSAFLLRAATLHRDRFPKFVNSHQSKDAVCNATLLAGHVTRYPHLYRNRHRRPPDFLDSRITPHGVPYPHWFEKRHPFHRHGDDSRLCGFRSKNPAAKVHLRGQPSAENVNVPTYVLRHAKR